MNRREKNPALSWPESQFIYRVPAYWIGYCCVGILFLWLLILTAGNFLYVSRTVQADGHIGQTAGGGIVALIQITPKDAINIESGQALLLQIEGYPAKDYGICRGKVKAIEQKAELKPGMPSFQVISTIETPSLKMPDGGAWKFLPGLKVQSTIITGRMTFTKWISNYFF